MRSCKLISALAMLVLMAACSAGPPLEHTGTARTPNRQLKIEHAATFTATETTTSTSTSTVTATAPVVATVTRTVTDTITQTGSSTASATFTVTAPSTITATQTAEALGSITETITTTGTQTGSAPGTFEQIYTFTGTITAIATAVAYYTSWPHSKGNTATATSMSYSHGTGATTVTRTLTSTVNGTETKTATGTISGTGTRTGTTPVTVTASVTSSITNAGTGTGTVAETGTGSGIGAQTWTAQITRTAINSSTHATPATETVTSTVTLTSAATLTQTETRTLTASFTDTCSSTSTVTETGGRPVTITTTTTATATRTVTRTRTDTRTSTELGCGAKGNAITATFEDASIIINSGAMVDSYRSSDGAYGGTNTGSDGNVVAAGAITNNGGTINGRENPNTPSELAMPSIPSDAAYLPGGASAPGNLNINQASESVTLAPGAYLVQSLNVNSPGKITIAPAGPVTIFVTGSLNLGGLENPDGIPANLTFVVTQPGWVNVNVGGSLWGSIYAPTSEVNLNGPVYGYVVGKRVVLNSGAAVHYDVSIRSTCGVPVPQLTCVMRSNAGSEWTAVFGYTNPGSENVRIPADQVLNWAAETGGGSAVFHVPEWFLATGDPAALVAKSSPGTELTWRLLGVVVSARENSAPQCETVSTSSGLGIVVGGVVRKVLWDPAKVDAYSTLPAESDGLTPPHAQGHLEGTAAVTHDGEATYDLPLWVPPGRAGIQPTLALHYGSRAGNGQMGRGFSLSGLSQIKRCGRSVGRDGAASPVRWSNTDYFCLDGKRLIAISGGNGGEGTRYRTEIDNFSRISSLSVDALGPRTFLVETMDGRKLWYGKSTGRLEGKRDVPVTSGGSPGTLDARYAWALDRVEDRFGNYMTIQYSLLYFGKSVSFLPSSIAYTGHPTVSPDRFVEFQYESSPAGYGVQQTYVAGMAFDQTTLLTDLRMKVGGSVVRRYHFAYLKSRPLPELNSVTEGDGVTEREPTIFDWHEEANSDFYSADLGSITDITTNVDPARRILRAGDIDGDGLDDLVYQKRNPDTAEHRWDWYLRRSKGIDGFGEPERLPLNAIGTNDLLPDIRLTDINNDGKVDVAVREAASPDFLMPFAPVDCHDSYGTPVTSFYSTSGGCKKDVSAGRWPPHTRWFANQYPTGFLEGGVESLAAQAGELDLYTCSSLAGLNLNSIMAGDLDADGLPDILRLQAHRRYGYFENIVVNSPGQEPRDCVLGGETRWGVRKNEGGVLTGYKLLATVGETNLAIPPPGGQGGPMASTYTTATPGLPVPDLEPYLVDVDGSGRVAVVAAKDKQGGGPVLHLDHALDYASYHLVGTPSATPLPTDVGFAFSEETPLSLQLKGAGQSAEINRYMFADVNGDGLPEAIAYGRNGGALHMLINRGGHFIPWTERVPLDNNPKYRAMEFEAFWHFNVHLGPISLIPEMAGWQFVSHAMVPGDFNGDGLTDLLMLDRGCVDGDNSRAKAVLYQSNGHKLMPRELNVPVGDGAGPQGLECPNYRTSVVFDGNGDGMPDIAQIEGGRLKVYYNMKEPRAVKNIREGRLRTTQFTYGPYRWKASDVKSPDAMPSYPQIGIKSGLWTAGMVQIRPCPTCSPTAVQTHTYQDGRRDLQTREFLGFARHTVYDIFNRTTVYTMGNHTPWVTPSESGATVSKRLYPWRGKVLDRTTTIPVGSGGNSSTIVESEATVYRPMASPGFAGVCRQALPSAVIRARTYEDVAMPDLSQLYGQGPPYSFPSGFPFATLSLSTFAYDQYDNLARRDLFTGWRLTGSDGAAFDPDAPDLSPGPGLPAFANPLEVETEIRTFDYDEERWLLRKPRSLATYSTGVDGKVGVREVSFVTDPVTGAPTDMVYSPEDPVHKLSRHIDWSISGLILSETETGNANVDGDGQWKGQTRKTSYEYAHSGSYAPNAIVNAMGQKIEVVHSPVTNNLIVSVDADLRTTRYRYDTYGRLRKVERDGDGDTTTYSYPKADAEFVAKTTRTTGAGSREEVVYDCYDRPIQVRRAALNSSGGPDTAVVDIVYDVPQRQVSTSLPYFASLSSQGSVTRTFDEAGRMISEALSYAPGNSDSPVIGPTAYGYVGNSVTAMDGAGRSQTVTVDSAGRVRIVVGQDQGQSASARQYFTYFGLPAGGRDDAGNRVRIAYDAAGRLESVEDPDAGKTTFTTNAFGEVILRRHEGIEIREEVDVLGRPTSRFENGSEVAGFQWDAPNATGALWKTRTDQSVDTERTYDSLGRPRSISWSIDNATYDVWTTFDYMGRLASVAYPALPNGDRFRADYEYGPAPDWGAQLTGVTRGGHYLWKLKGLDASGRASSFAYGNGMLTDRAYYLGSNLLKDSKVSISGGTGTRILRQDHYGYDLAGNVLTMQDLSRGGAGASYTYDGLNRLWTWTDMESGVAKRYEYDSIGNLRWVRAAAGGGADVELRYEGASRNAGPHAVTSLGGEDDFQYNARGERTAGLGRTSSYTSFGLPIRATAGSVSTTYTYDAHGERVLRESSNGSSTLSIGGVFERRIDAAGTTYVNYVIADGETIGQASLYPETMLYFHKDRLGTTTGVSDSGGGLVALRRDPWGRLLSPPNKDVRVGFTGHLDDAETGLIDMGGRIYDPETTRFLTPDPVPWSPAAGIGNRYAYVLNDPTNLVDPSGFREERVDDVKDAQPKQVDGRVCGPGYCTWTDDENPRLQISMIWEPQGQFGSSEGGGGICAVAGAVDQTGQLSSISLMTPLTANSGATGSNSSSGQNQRGSRTLDLNPFYAGANPKGSIGPVMERSWSLIGPTSTGSFGAMIFAGPLFGRLGGALFGRALPTAAATRGAAQAAPKLLSSVPARVVNAANHIFGPKSLGRHNLGGVLNAFKGDATAAFYSLENAAQALANQGAIRGVFQTTVEVAGSQVTVRGAVIEGIAQLSTAFIP